MKEDIIKLRLEGKSYNEIKKILGCSKSTISYHCNKLELSEPVNKITSDVYEKIQCDRDSGLTVNELSYKYGISSSTIKKHTKSNKPKKDRNKCIDNTYGVCLVCGEQLTIKNRTFCSLSCSSKYKSDKIYEENTKKWLNGEIDGVVGKTSTAKWIKRYLINTRGEKCEECGWNKRNEYTGNIPIELEHIDGDFMNNKISNLKLLCPSCHSLTPTYKGANKKSGSPRSKYYRGL